MSNLTVQPRTVAYADPPYLGMCGRYDHFHPDGRCWDDVETHRLLIARLVDEYPDGWALSLHTPSLRTLLPFCPERSRVLAWVKPFAFFKPGVTLSYAWEPVIVDGEKLGQPGRVTRDWVAVNAYQDRRGLLDRTYSMDADLARGAVIGRKPDGFSCWLFDVLGLGPGDRFVDIFAGTGAVSRAWDIYRTRWENPSYGLPLFGEEMTS